jgi:hypothetical protein
VRRRNAHESITGLLVYDRGEFLQWLEGPEDALLRVWASILRDPRHTDIERLETPPRRDRLFPDWRMQLGRVAEDGDRLGSPARDAAWCGGCRDASRGDVAAMPVPESALRRLQRGRGARPGSLDGLAFWGRLPPAPDMARSLLGREHGPADALIERALALHPSAGAIGSYLLGPAARCMGDAWGLDLCDSTDLLVAQSRLQRLVMRADRAQPRGAGWPRGVALVAPAIGETHLAGVSLAGMALRGAGWATECAFPHRDEALCDMLRHAHYDVLHLALSDVVSRSHRLEALAASIRAARAASVNPHLVIVVSGRAFAEASGLEVVVGADGYGIACDSDAVRRLAALTDRRREPAPARRLRVEAALRELAQRLMARRYWQRSSLLATQAATQRTAQAGESRRGEGAALPEIG